MRSYAEIMDNYSSNKSCPCYCMIPLSEITTSLSLVNLETYFTWQNQQTRSTNKAIILRRENLYHQPSGHKKDNITLCLTVIVQQIIRYNQNYNHQPENQINALVFHNFDEFEIAARINSIFRVELPNMHDFFYNRIKYICFYNPSYPIKYYGQQSVGFIENFVKALLLVLGRLPNLTSLLFEQITIFGAHLPILAQFLTAAKMHGNLSDLIMSLDVSHVTTYPPLLEMLTQPKSKIKIGGFNPEQEATLNEVILSHTDAVESAPQYRSHSPFSNKAQIS